MSLSLGQKAGWGLADMGIVVFVIVKQLLILAFMNSFLGIPIALAGAVTTAVLLLKLFSSWGYFIIVSPNTSIKKIVDNAKIEF